MYHAHVRAVTCFRVIHSIRRLSREAREASPFSVLPFRSVSPPYFFCLLFHCALPSEGSYLAVRVYPGYKTAEANKWHRKRIAPECRASAKYTRGSVWERTCRQKEKGGVHDTRFVISAEVATPASLTNQQGRPQNSFNCQTSLIP